MTRWYHSVRFVFWSTWMGAAFWSLSQWRTPPATGAFEVATAEAPFTRHAEPLDSSLAFLSVLLERMPFDNAEVLELQAESEQAQVAVVQPPIETASLVLRGIAQGVVRQAIIDGLPGTDRSRTLRIGESVGDVRLVAVGSDSVLLSIRGAHVTVFMGRALSVPR